MIMCQVKPALSVIVPVYNAGNYVVEAVQSILNQDCNVDLEILVVNDHSTDPATLNALTTLPCLASNIRILENSGSRGPGAARNVGLRAARGSWVGFLDADDLWPPGSLKSRWDLVVNVPHARWIAGHYLVLRPDGSLSLPQVRRSSVFESAERTDTHLRFADAVPGLIDTTMLVWTCTTLIERALLDETGGFREDLLYGEDWYLFMNLALVASLIFVPSVVAHMRRQHESLTTQDAAYSPLSYKAFRLAYFGMRFRKYRRQIRWAIMAINRSHSNHHCRRRNRYLAAKHALLALLWGPNDLDQAKTFIKRLAELTYWRSNIKLN